MRGDSEAELNPSNPLPREIGKIRKAALKAIGEVVPAGPPQSETEAKGLVLSSRTNGGRNLPPHYLVYFLLVDLLEFPNLGKWEKTAWTVPIRYQGKLYGIEHRKMGLGIFAPNLDKDARMSTTPTAEADADAVEICQLIKKGVIAAKPYFEWLANQAVSKSHLNVNNKCHELFNRYQYFLDLYNEKKMEAEARKDEVHKEELGPNSYLTHRPYFDLKRQANWLAISAIDAFFSWTEHLFIHLAVVAQGTSNGEDIADLTQTEWREKFKKAISLECSQAKKYYDELIVVRNQLRNFVAHGAFGKNGETFQFHSSAGAVPVLMPHRKTKNRFALSGELSFKEDSVFELINDFITYLWESNISPAMHYVQENGLPTILTMAKDGTYSKAMNSQEDMNELIEHISGEIDRSANMDW